jgi:heme/copper-type cytochrome/quinol oxidase subunit 3
MRKLVVTATLLLAVSGLLLAFAQPAGIEAGARKLAALAHIWLGVAYLVIFPLYAWEHVMKNRRWLAVLRAVSVSGVLQLTSGIVLLLTGIVLLAYGGALLRGIRAAHHGLTYPLLAALLWHWLSPKRWRAPETDGA